MQKTQLFPADLAGPAGVIPAFDVAADVNLVHQLARVLGRIGFALAFVRIVICAQDGKVTKIFLRNPCHCRVEDIL